MSDLQECSSVYAGDKMADVFDELSTVDIDDLPSVFVDKLYDIHKFDATEIQDFLLSLHVNNSAAEKKNLLVNIRQKVFVKCIENSPDLVNAELYNRRKLESFANDIYVLGDIAMNYQTNDNKRLAKVLKLRHGLRTLNEINQENESQMTDTYVESATIDSVDTHVDFVPQAVDRGVMQICMQVNDSVNQLTAKIESMSSELAYLRHEVIKMKSQNTANPELVDGSDTEMATSTATKEDIARLVSMNESLKETVTKINCQLQEQADDTSDDEDEDETDEGCIPEGSIVIGDSLLRNIESTCDDLKVECINGAKYCNLKKSLKKINPRKDKVANLYIVCGTNDCATKKPCEKIVEDCTTILQLAKERATNVYLSSVMPRIDEKADAQKIETLNQLLMTTCNDLDIDFINNDQNFRYRNNSIDESLLLPGDGLHLSEQGVNKLISNLDLKDKIKANFATTRMENTKPSTTDPPLPQIQDTTTPLLQENSVLFRGPKHPLSNLYMTPLYIWNISFRSVEHAYHYRKAITMNQHITAEKIRHAPSSFDAMDIGRAIKTDERWKNLKAKVMYQLLDAKASQCPSFCNTLQSTTGRSLIEDTNGEYWARGKFGSGLNMMGHLLMTLRDSLPTRPLALKRRPPQNPHRSANVPRSNEKQIHCYNCGEKSHTADSCRLPSPVMCFTCNQQGHKKKFCYAASTRFNA